MAATSSSLADLRKKVNDLNAQYDSFFAGQPRISRDVALMDSLRDGLRPVVTARRLAIAVAHPAATSVATAAARPVVTSAMVRHVVALATAVARPVATSAMTVVPRPPAAAQKATKSRR